MHILQARNSFLNGFKKEGADFDVFAHLLIAELCNFPSSNLILNQQQQPIYTSHCTK